MIHVSLVADQATRVRAEPSTGIKGDIRALALIHDGRDIAIQTSSFDGEVAFWTSIANAAINLAAKAKEVES